MTESYTIHEGTLAAAETIVRHRREMFFDMGTQDPAVLDEMADSFRPWLAEKISKREYLSWFAIAENSSVAAGAGLWLMNWPPGLYTVEPWRGNILNVYTEHGHRRRGAGSETGYHGDGMVRSERSSPGDSPRERPGTPAI